MEKIITWIKRTKHKIYWKYFGQTLHPLLVAKRIYKLFIYLIIIGGMFYLSFKFLN
ncbi:MAG TPA: hypothetical protein PLD27_04860 [bacterium]|nr:hypothetical protein [bacterium]HOL47967.1 hypothetical protein [bacterium]HPQ18045.1 hypothetical protein [bacterium]